MGVELLFPWGVGGSSASPKLLSDINISITIDPLGLIILLFQGGDSEHILKMVHDIATNNIGSLCYQNTYK